MNETPPAQKQTQREAESAAQVRDHVRRREEWFRSGRTARGENAADLLHRAYRQKMQMRADARLRAARVQAVAETQRAAQASSRKASSSLSPLVTHLGGRQSRAAGPGESPSVTTSGSRDNAIAQRESSSTPNFFNLNWTSMGPSPTIFDPTGGYAYGGVTGRVTAIAVDQRDATGGTVYIAGASGGVWKTTNGTANPSSVIWTPLTDHEASLAAGAIALQPGTDTVLVGTGETNSSPDSYYGMGVLRSTDAGAHWTLIPAANGGTRSFRGLGFSKIAFSTANPNLVVASAASTNGASPGGNGAELQGADGRGIYYSTDAGQTWKYATVLDTGGVPTQAGSVGDIAYVPQFGKFYAVVRWHGYYSSSDGVTWTRLPFQPGTIDSSSSCPPSPTNNQCPEYRGSLSVDESNGGVYTIFVDANDNDQGIYMLTSDGGAWTKLGQATIDSCNDASVGGGCGTQQGAYNLYIKAVPNGTTTDLYVGAINIFKCTRGVDPTCSAWKNLTHVYACTPVAAPSGVHPDQHAIDFIHASPTRMYFGNDGGIYRALDATGLSSSSCTGSNAFDNLNGTLGSLSEFVQFSQHPTDSGILLGGLQDNGSPSLSPGNGAVWQDLNQSDGGYNAIDPASPSTFYSSFFDISVQRCSSGTSCTTGGWTYVAQPVDVGGDKALFYPPFLLDPGGTSHLLLGTCRLWRGNNRSFTALSNNFASGDATACGTQSNVRSIAAGGPASGSGSQVIYAGTDSIAPVNGHVFVTTNADGGVSTWVDRTASINPSGYDISDIALSPYDSSGHTAYLTIMGFGTRHVFKTTDAGANWADKTANLPDAPVNSIVVDPVNAGTLYVGTDIGVFLSADDGVSWAEFGTGLPNVPVVKLKAFVASGVKKLRAATYGRGMWQIDLPSPDILFMATPLSFSTVLGRASAGQTVTLTNNSAAPVTIGSITASGDYGVSNDCPAVLGSTASCSVTLVFHPVSAGARVNTLTLTSSAAGPARTLALNGNGVDFTLTLARPTRPGRNGSRPVATMLRAGEMATVDVNLASSGAVGLPPQETTVALECGNAPAGIRCLVEPATLELASGSSMVHVRLSMERLPIKARRLTGVATARDYTVELKVSSGTVTRVVGIPVRVE